MYGYMSSITIKKKLFLLIHMSLTQKFLWCGLMHKSKAFYVSVSDGTRSSFNSNDEGVLHPRFYPIPKRTVSFDLTLNVFKVFIVVRW